MDAHWSKNDFYLVGMRICKKICYQTGCSCYISFIIRISTYRWYTQQSEEFIKKSLLMGIYICFLQSWSYEESDQGANILILAPLYACL